MVDQELRLRCKNTFNLQDGNITGMDNKKKFFILVT